LTTVESYERTPPVSALFRLVWLNDGLGPFFRPKRTLSRCASRGLILADRESASRWFVLVVSHLLDLAAVMFLLGATRDLRAPGPSTRRSERNLWPPAIKGVMFYDDEISLSPPREGMFRCVR
jgi:hypothetical protein